MRSLRAVPDTPPRAIIYVRQSVHREESISLELQEIACRDYCDRAGYEVLAVEADPGISGRTWNRPAVQRSMSAIEDGEADVIVLWKWSRLSRSRKDWALAIDRADLAGGRIESATEPIDTATASGRFARGVMTEYAAFQSEQIGEQWEEVRQRRLGLGLPASGRLPFGWKWQDGGIAPEPAQAAVVVEMYRRYLAGDGSAAIAAWLNTEGIPAPNGGTWNRVRPLTVLDSPVHAGLIPYRDKTYPGAHDGIVSIETWEAFRSTRADRRNAPAAPRRYEHLLVGLVWCSCGRRMHGKGSVTDGKWYGGYLCPDRTIEHPARAYVSAKVIDPIVTEWLMSFDAELPRATAKDSTARSDREHLLRELAALDTELDNYTRQLGRDIIPEAAYLRARARIEHESATVRASLAKIDRRTSSTPDPANVARLRDEWTEMTQRDRNRALTLLISRIDLTEDEHITLTPTWSTSSVTIG